MLARSSMSISICGDSVFIELRAKGTKDLSDLNRGIFEFADRSTFALLLTRDLLFEFASLVIDLPVFGISSFEEYRQSPLFFDFEMSDFCEKLRFIGFAFLLSKTAALLFVDPP